MESKIIPARVNPLYVHPKEQRLSLDDTWQFCLDPDSKLSGSNIHESNVKMHPIQVPGCWQGQDFGGDGCDEVYDFRFVARTFRATSSEPGMYLTSFTIPSEWNNRRIWLNFGGIHPTGEIWVNGEMVGVHKYPFVPVRFDVTELCSSHTKNVLAVKITEEARLYGSAFNWQGNWSGLYRNVELTATGKSLLEYVGISPDVDNEELAFEVEIADAPAQRMTLKGTIAPTSDETSQVRFDTKVKGGGANFKIKVPSPLLWSPDEPNLYRVDLELLADDGKMLDACSERVGFVKLSAEGKHFLINNEPYYMRGTGDFISCPETGSPDTNRERWRRKLRTLRNYGYNYVRCQSYVYGPEYYDAADEIGLLIQSEMGILGGWGGHNNWHTYQWLKPTPDHYPTLKAQWDMVVKRDVCHPSANIYCMSNENWRSTDFPRTAWECYHSTKATKPTSMVIWTSGGYSKEMPADFINFNSDAFKPEELDAFDKPFIEHEFKWWSSFPDVRLRKKYNGAIRPYAIEIAAEAAKSRGQEHLLETYAINSQRLQFAEAKAKMENLRRDRPKLAGICHFNAMDTNPSPQGIVDEFYEHKYADAEMWQQVNGDTVILSSLGFDDRIICSGEQFKCKLYVSDFSHPPLRSPKVDWRLVADEEVLAQGGHSYEHTPYRTCAAGEMAFSIPKITAPVAAQLEATVGESKRTFSNAWNLWILPEEKQQPQFTVYGKKLYTWLKTLEASEATPEVIGKGGLKVLLSEVLDENTQTFVENGGRLILAAAEGMGRPHPLNFGYVKYFFTPPANYGPYEDGQNGTVIRKHPMLGEFPHEAFADFQFFRMIDTAPPLDLEPFGLDNDDPVIRVIHRYPVCRPLGYITERRFGKGGIVFVALNLDQSLPEARYLLRQIWNYASGEEFKPETEITAGQVQKIAAMTALP